MGNGFDVLDEQIAKLRALPKGVAGAAPAVAKAFKAELDKNIAAGVDPDGKPWPKTKTGGQPLKNAAKALEVKAIGTVIVATLTGPEAKHDRGIARGHVQRKILPRALTGPLAAAVKKVVEEKAAEVMQ